MHSEDITLQSDGLGIAARVAWPAHGGDPAPALVVCHGFGSCKENHAAFAAQSAAAGWAVLAFDFRGHGASDGCVDSHTVHDIRAALDWLRAQPGIDPTRLVVRGSSMGAYFAIHAARRWPDVAACVALNPADEAGLATLLHDAHDPSTFYGQWRARGEGFPRVMGCDLDCWIEGSDVYGAVTKIAPRPLLLIHCQGDEMVPWQLSQRLYDAAGDPKAFWLLEGGDHRFAAHDATLSARTLDWLAEVL
ncbi:MAG TPA: alpha/beta fold hydrolase [Chloroflexia bacterium]|nr:alpha/beta fold hydrolase [Chloroflexia bacterium]